MLRSMIDMLFLLRIIRYKYKHKCKRSGTLTVCMLIVWARARVLSIWGQNPDYEDEIERTALGLSGVQFHKRCYTCFKCTNLYYTLHLMSYIVLLIDGGIRRGYLEWTSRQMLSGGHFGLQYSIIKVYFIFVIRNWLRHTFSWVTFYFSVQFGLII